MSWLEKGNLPIGTVCQYWFVFSFLLSDACRIPADNVLKPKNRTFDAENIRKDIDGGRLAVIPWVPWQLATGSYGFGLSESGSKLAEVQMQTEEAGVESMEIEEVREIPTSSGVGNESFHQQQQHCMTAQLPPSASNSVMWSWWQRWDHFHWSMSGFSQMNANDWNDWPLAVFDLILHSHVKLMIAFVIWGFIIPAHMCIFLLYYEIELIFFSFVIYHCGFLWDCILLEVLFFSGPPICWILWSEYLCITMLCSCWYSKIYYLQFNEVSEHS